MVHIKVYYAREEDREAWSKTMFSQTDAAAPRLLVAEFDLRYTKTQGTRESPTPDEVADFVFAGFNGVGKPLETFLRASVRFMSVGDLLEIDGLKLLCTKGVYFVEPIEAARIEVLAAEVHGTTCTSEEESHHQGGNQNAATKA